MRLEQMIQQGILPGIDLKEQEPQMVVNVQWFTLKEQVNEFASATFGELNERKRRQFDQEGYSLYTLRDLYDVDRYLKAADRFPETVSLRVSNQLLEDAVPKVQITRQDLFSQVAAHVENWRPTYSDPEIYGTFAKKVAGAYRTLGELASKAEVSLELRKVPATYIVDTIALADTPLKK